MVLARDTVSGTGQTVAKQVLSTSVRNVEGTLLITFAGGATIESTGNHPFFVDGAGFVQADQLGIGSEIVTRAGPNLVVKSIEKKTGTVPVYNFVVEDFHSYFVGNPDLTGGGAWVHNGLRCPIAVYPDGTAILTSAAELEQSLRNGGLKSYPNVKTSEPGNIYTDARNGNLYRVMQGAGQNLRRLITHHPNGNPLLPNGANIPNGLKGNAVKSITHFPLEP